jgi:hypothetical protein
MLFSRRSRQSMIHPQLACRPLHGGSGTSANQQCHLGPVYNTERCPKIGSKCSAHIEIYSTGQTTMTSITFETDQVYCQPFVPWLIGLHHTIRVGRFPDTAWISINLAYIPKNTSELGCHGPHVRLCVYSHLVFLQYLV